MGLPIQNAPELGSSGSTSFGIPDGPTLRFLQYSSSSIPSSTGAGKLANLHLRNPKERTSATIGGKNKTFRYPPAAE